MPNLVLPTARDRRSSVDRRGSVEGYSRRSSVDGRRSVDGSVFSLAEEAHGYSCTATCSTDMALAAAASIPAIVFGALFSSIGAGPYVYNSLMENLDTSSAVASSLPLVAFLAWFINIERRGAFLQALFACLFVLSALTATALVQQVMPAFPLAVYCTVLPLYALAVKSVAEGTWLDVFDGHVEAYQLFSRGWQASAGVALLLLLAGLAHDAAARLTGGMEDDPVCLAAHSEAASIACEREMIMWALPYICAFVHALYALLAFALVDADRDEEQVVVRMAGVVSALAICGAWVSAEVAGEASTLSRVITLFAVCGTAGLALGLLFYVRALDEDVVLHGAELEQHLGRDLSTSRLNWSHFNRARQLRESASECLHGPAGDWAFALLLISPAPPLFAAYVLADVVRAAAHRLVYSVTHALCTNEGSNEPHVAVDGHRDAESSEFDGWVSEGTARRLREISGAPSEVPLDVPRGGWLAYQMHSRVDGFELSAPRKREAKSVKEWSGVLCKVTLSSKDLYQAPVY